MLCYQVLVAAARRRRFEADQKVRCQTQIGYPSARSVSDTVFRILKGFPKEGAVGKVADLNHRTRVLMFEQEDTVPMPNGPGESRSGS